jgi:hypothetical protein
MRVSTPLPCDQRFLASRYRVAYIAIGPLLAAGASKHHGYSVRSKVDCLPHKRTAAGGL